MTDDVAREARSVACADAPGRWINDYSPAEVLDAFQHYLEWLDQARQDVHDSTLWSERTPGGGDRTYEEELTAAQRRLTDKLLDPAARSESEDTQPKATADPNWWSFGEYTGDDCPNCGRMRLMNCQDDSDRARVICEKCEWEPAESKYRGEVDWNPNEGVVCNGSTNHIEFQPTPTQADVDALVEAATELRAAEWASVGLSSAKMADRVTQDQIRGGAFRILEAQKRVDAALIQFQKG